MTDPVILLKGQPLWPMHWTLEMRRQWIEMQKTRKNCMSDAEFEEHLRNLP